MSLILEALRKSEEQRRLGETPTLATVPAWTRRKPRRFWRPPTVVALVVAAVVAGWWYGDRGGVEDADEPRRSASPAAAGRAAGDRPPAAAQSKPQVRGPAVITEPVPDRGDLGMATRDSGGVRRAATTAPAEPFANSPELRTPAPPTQQTPYVPPEAALPEPLPEPGLNPDDAQLAAAPSPVPATALAPQPAAPPPPSAPVAAAATTPAAVATTPAAAAPAAGAAAVPQGAAAVPLIFELSLATRQALPPLKVNMHVYNEQPAGRFVIIDGTRATEGEALGENVKVVGIRPDGVVIDFRGQQFLLPRGGR